MVVAAGVAVKSRRVGGGQAGCALADVARAAGDDFEHDDLHLVVFNERRPLVRVLQTVI